MNKEPRFDAIQIGDEIPSLVKGPVTTQQLVKYAGASGDYYQIHYDEAFAKNVGLPGVIIHGLLKGAFLGQLLTDWVGEIGTLKKFGCSYRGMDYPGDTLTCRGKVTGKYSKDGENLVELEIWVENQRGEKTTPGNAIVALP